MCVAVELTDLHHVIFQILQIEEIHGFRDCQESASLDYLLNKMFL